MTNAGSITQCTLVKANAQVIFRQNGLSDQDLSQLQNLTSQRATTLKFQLHKIKSLVITNSKFNSSSDIMYMLDHKFHFGKVCLLVAHLIGSKNTFLHAVYAKIQHYTTPCDISDTSLLQFSYIPTTLTSEYSFINFNKVIGNIFVCDNIISPTNIIPNSIILKIQQSPSFDMDDITNHFNLLIDTCYYVKKNYDTYL